MCPGTGEEDSVKPTIPLVPGAEERQGSSVLMAESVSCELKEDADLHKHHGSRRLGMQGVNRALTGWPQL